MPISSSPMLPEDRKHLDVPEIPEPGMRFRKDGSVWQLISIDIQRGIFDRGRFEPTRLTLGFVAVDPVTFDCVDPKKASATSASPRLCVK